MFHHRRALGAIRAPFVAASGGYTAQGVKFDGTTTYLDTAAPFTGQADSKVGICSFWIQVLGADGTGMGIIAADGDTTTGLRIVRDAATNKIFFVGHDSGGTLNFIINGASTFLLGSGWKHCLVAWDNAASVTQIYVNDISDSPTVTTQTNSAIDYTIGFWEFGTIFATYVNPYSGNIADFYLNTATTLDLSNSTNRRKFISAGGAPVDLGSTGNLPTGTAPILYLSGAVASWGTNKGTGGGFTAHGTLVAAATNPP